MKKREIIKRLIGYVRQPDYFICPSCGGTHFGTDLSRLGPDGVGVCHTVGCSFEWRREMDSDYGFGRKSREFSDVMTEALKVLDS